MGGSSDSRGVAGRERWGPAHTRSQTWEAVLTAEEWLAGRDGAQPTLGLKPEDMKSCEYNYHSFPEDCYKGMLSVFTERHISRVCVCLGYKICAWLLLGGWC